MSKPSTLHKTTNNTYNTYNTYNNFDRTANQMRQALELWQQWLSESNWYQLDRWLKNTLGKNKKYGKRDRLFYGDVLFNAARFGYWAAMVIDYKDIANNGTPQNSPAPKTVANVVLAFTQQATSASALKSQLRLLALSAKGADFLSLCQWRAQCNPTATLPESLKNYASCIKSIAQFSEHNLQGLLAWHGIPLQYIDNIQALDAITHEQGAARSFVVAQDSRPPLWLRLNHLDKKND